MSEIDWNKDFGDTIIRYYRAYTTCCSRSFGLLVIISNCSGVSSCRSKNFHGLPSDGGGGLLKVTAGSFRVTGK